MPESHPRSHHHLAEALIVSLRRLAHPEHDGNRDQHESKRDVAANEIIEPDRHQQSQATDQNQRHDRHPAQHRRPGATGEDGIAKAVHAS